MVTRRTISFAVILMMLWSIVAPASASAGHCSGTDAVNAALADAHGGDHHATAHSHGSGEAGEDHHASDHHRAGHHYDLHHTESDHAAVTGSIARSALSPAAANPFSFCCTDAAGVSLRHTLDVSTLTTSATTWTLIPAVVVHSAFVSSLVDQARPLASAFKIGASPPWIAAAARHTYQRTCLLLI